MARRKRLTPARAFGAEPGIETGGEGRAPEVKSALPPIAQVAGQSATEAAFQEVAGEMQRAREEGRLIQLIPLDAIVEDHLVRDRIGGDEEEMAALVASIHARGQRSPIEVIETEPGRYGLISGWRRLQALRRLRGSAAPDDGRFTKVRALVSTPHDAGEAYLAMVEENEIRADLSHYERARIVARSVEAGAFEDVQSALRTLFANASRSKRSKVKSFIVLVEHLDDVLRFPTHLGERLGLELAGRLNEEAGFVPRLRAALQAQPAQTPEEEAALLRKALDEGHAAKAPKTKLGAATKSGRESGREAGEELTPGIWLSRQGKAKRLVLSGPGVDDDLAEALAAWLAQR